MNLAIVLLVGQLGGGASLDIDWRDANTRNDAVGYLRVPSDSEAVDLPNGKQIDTDSEFLGEFKKQLKHGLFPRDQVVTAFGDKSGVQAVFTSWQGKLTGPVLVFHEDQKIACTASFSEGLQNGPLLAWDKDGNRVLFGHFRKGWRDGWFAGFDGKGKLTILAQYKLDKRTAAYAIGQNGKVVESAGAEELPFGSQLSARFGELDTALKATKKNEAKLRKAVADWDEKQRRALAAANANAGRDAILERGRSTNTGIVQAAQAWAASH